MTQATRQYNILLTEDERRKLEQLAEETHLVKAAILRQIIIYAHAHICLQMPTCPNGRSCFVPQMHPRQPPKPLENPP